MRVVNFCRLLTCRNFAIFSILFGFFVCLFYFVLLFGGGTGFLFVCSLCFFCLVGFLVFHDSHCTQIYMIQFIYVFMYVFQITQDYGLELVVYWKIMLKNGMLDAVLWFRKLTTKLMFFSSKPA